MARCKECIHYDVCYLTEIDNEIRDSGENPDCLFFLRATDVVEVVRCKDCKHFVSEVCRHDFALNFCRGDDFCCYGERRGAE